MPIFDWTISVGNLLTVLTFLLAAGGIALRFANRVEDLDNRIATLARSMISLERGIEKMTEVLIQQGRQEERITALDRRMQIQGERVDELQRRLMQTMIRAGIRGDE